MTRRLLTGCLCLAACVAALSFSARPVQAQPPKPWRQCPAIGASPSCGVLIVINPNNSITVYSDPSVGPYEASEDTLTGVLNNSNSTVSSLPLTGSTDIFGFESDGICDPSTSSFGAPIPAGCPFGLTHYEGPGVSFSNISANNTSGTVNFNPPLPPGGSAYFGLEEMVNSTQVTAPFNTTCPTTTATVGVPYSSQLVGLNGSGSYTWSLTAGSLAPLTLSSSGLVSGTPAAAVTLSFTIQIRDTSSNSTASQQCSIGVSLSGGGGPFSVTAGPVMSTIAQSACGVSPPTPAKSSFLATDPNITYWVSMTGVNLGDILSLTYSGPGGASYTGQVSAQWNALWVCWTLPAAPAFAPAGSWTVAVTRNGQNVAAAAAAFSVSGSGSAGSPVSGAATGGSGGGGNFGINVLNGPVYTESGLDSMGNCVTSTPPGIATFGSNDPVVTVWFVLGPLSPQITVLTRFTYNGSVQTQLDETWGFPQQGNYVLCPSFLPNGGAAGSWTVTSYLNGNLSQPIVSFSFTVIQGTGGGTPAVSVSGGPVTSTVTQSTCGASPPSPARTSFTGTDPDINYWVSLSGVTVGDTIALTYRGPGGVSYTGQVSAQWTALWVCWTLPASPASAPAGNWSVAVTRNGQTIQNAAAQFTLSNSGSGGGGGTPASGQASPAGGGGGGVCTPPSGGSGSYTLSSISVTRTYGAGDGPSPQQPGTVTAAANTCSFNFGWNFNWPDATAGPNHNIGTSTVNLTQAPLMVNPGSMASLAASMTGHWDTTGYGVTRDHTISLTGAAGSGSQTVQGNASGVQDLNFTASNSTVVPAASGNQVVLTLNATLLFGATWQTNSSDSGGTMQIQLIYTGSGGGGGGGVCGAGTLTTYDLTQNWSTVNNPNCPWSYQEGASALPRTSNWNAAGGIWTACPEPAWAPSNTGGGFLPAMMQMTSCTAPSLSNTQAGDIVVHTNDGTNGNPSLGAANILFTVPAAGTWTFGGSIWNAKPDSSRPQDWQVTVNGVSVASGTLNGTVSRAQPQMFNFTRSLNAGDSVDLTLSKNASSTFGNFTGVTMTAAPGGGGGGGTPPGPLTTAGCSYNVQPSDGPGGQPPALPNESAAGNLEFAFVFSQTGCKFAAYSPVSWVHVTPTTLTAVSGAQNQGSVTIQIDPQPAGGAQRQATIQAADKQITVIQLASSSSTCSYTLSSTNSPVFPSNPQPPANQGSFTATIAGTQQCTIQAAIDPAVPSAQQWAQITSSTTFSLAGAKTISYTVTQNCTTSARSLNIVITGTNPAVTLTYTINQSAAPASCTPPPTIGSGGITNSASFIPGGLIAQGSFFSIFGTNLGPPNPGVKAASYPLQTTLAGVSVTVADGKGNTVQALPVFVAEFQINAIMPSNAPLGSVQITATFNGVAGPPQNATVVKSAFGAFAVSAGRGPGIVQNAKPDGTRPLNSSLTTAGPNTYVVVWGTGLGPLPPGKLDSASPDTSFTPQVSSIQVFVGGIQVNMADQYAYAARAPGIAGVDQVQFPLPPNVPLGCYVPVQVAVNGNLYSNTVTMAINTSSQPCSDDNPLGKLVRDGGKNGTVNLVRLDISDPTDPTLTGTIDLGIAGFIQEPPGGPLGFDVNISPGPLGTCTYYNNLNLSGLGGGQFPVPAGQPLDAGATIKVSGPNGAQTLTYQDPSMPVSPYVGLLGAKGALSALVGKPSFLDQGAFTVSAAGGKDIGAFQFNMTVGTPATLTTQVSMIDRSQPLVLNWTGGNSATQAVFIAGYSSDPDKNATGAFQCVAPIGPGTFTIPTGMIANLPTTVTPSGNASGVLLFVTLPLGSQFTSFTTSSPAADHGYAWYNVGSLINNVTFK